MTNFNPNDQDSLNNALGDGNEDFIIVDERKPLNRSLVALVLIAAVGASLIYLMYLRGRFNADLQTPEQKETAQAVSDFMANSDSSIRQMELQLARTERAVASFQQSNAAGQVPLDALRVNPFIVEEESRPITDASMPRAVRTDPAEIARNAVGKVKIDMILFSGSTGSASISNRLYRVGDRMEVDSVPFTIKGITQNSVTLTHPTGEYVVEVSKGL